MPTWEIHDKWAVAKMGLSCEVTNFVNHLSDFPEQSHEFMAFCERDGVEILLQLLKVRDFKLIMKIPKYLQIEFLRFRKSRDYVIAWYLHYVLDYVKMAPALTPEAVINRTEEKFGTSPELEVVKEFVRGNAEEILRDCRCHNNSSF